MAAFLNVFPQPHTVAAEADPEQPPEAISVLTSERRVRLPVMACSVLEDRVTYSLPYFDVLQHGMMHPARLEEVLTPRRCPFPTS